MLRTPLTRAVVEPAQVIRPALLKHLGRDRHRQRALLPAGDPQAPHFNAVGKDEKGGKISSGFAIEDTAGIQKAIPKCIKEAIDSVRQ